MNDAPFAIGAVAGPASKSVSAVNGSSAVQAGKTINAGSFEAVLTQLSNNAVSDLKAGEASALAGLQGKASTREVVDAVMKAEQSLQTVIAVRDKVISAYLEITRMSI